MQANCWRGPKCLTRADVALFNESQSRIVITVTPENGAKAEEFLKSKSIPHSRLGTVDAAQNLAIQAAEKTFAWPLEKAPLCTRRNNPIAYELGEIGAPTSPSAHQQP